jgi:hypothetical protein
MKVPRWIVGALLIVAVAGVAIAGEQARPQPTAEHQELAMWIGTWEGQGEMMPGPFGPAGPMHWTEECKWFGDSKLHIVCTSKGAGPTGPMKGLGIIGYDAEKGIYTHYGVDDSGWAGYSEGTHSGESWTFTSEEMMGGARFHSRFTMTMESPTLMTFTWETSEDGASWTAMMKGSSEKQ